MNTHHYIQESFGHLLSKQKGSTTTEKGNSSNNYLQLVRSGILRYLQQKSMDYLANPASVCHNGTITVVASEIWDFLISSHPCILESQYRACILKKEVTEAILELSHCLPVPNFSLHYDIKRGRKNEQQIQSALVKRKKEVMLNHEQYNSSLIDVVSSPVIQQEKKKLKSESNNCCNNVETANLVSSNVFWNDVANHLTVQKKEKSKQQRQAAALQQRKIRATTNTTSYIQNSNSFYCMPMEECNELKNMLETFISGSQPSIEQSNPSTNADYYFKEDPAEFATVQNTNASVLMGNQEQEQLMDTSMEFGVFTDLIGNVEQVCEVDSEIDPSCKFDQLFEQKVQSTFEEEQFQIRIISQCFSPVDQQASSSASSFRGAIPMESLWQSASEDSSPYCNHVLQLTP